MFLTLCEAKEKIGMKKVFVVSAGIFASLLALPVMAGPNWALIEQGRKMAQHENYSRNLSADQETLSVDHGPRAQSSPWLPKEHKQALAIHSRDGKQSILAAHDQGKSNQS
jgi:hypothetical protein